MYFLFRLFIGFVLGFLLWILLDGIIWMLVTHHGLGITKTIQIGIKGLFFTIGAAWGYKFPRKIFDGFLDGI